MKLLHRLTTKVLNLVMTTDFKHLCMCFVTHHINIGFLVAVIIYIIGFLIAGEEAGFFAVGFIVCLEVGVPPIPKFSGKLQ